MIHDWSVYWSALVCLSAWFLLFSPSDSLCDPLVKCFISFLEQKCVFQLCEVALHTQTQLINNKICCWLFSLWIIIDQLLQPCTVCVCVSSGVSPSWVIDLPLSLSHSLPWCLMFAEIILTSVTEIPLSPSCGQRKSEVQKYSLAFSDPQAFPSHIYRQTRNMLRGPG